MFKTRLLKKAILYAKKKAMRLKDISASSRKLEFSFSGAPLLNGHILSPCGVLGLARMFKIPTQWINIKMALEDGKHLEESFSRHIKMMEEQKVVLRTTRNKEGNLEIYATFPERAVHVDILPMLRLVREHLAPSIESWSFIHITNYTLRMFGIFKAGTGDYGLTSGAYITTSQDGSFGIKLAQGTGWSGSQKMAIVRKEWSFKRIESDEGDLQKRVIKVMQDLDQQKESKLIFSTARKNEQLLKEIGVGDNRVNVIVLGRKHLTLPRRLDNLILGSWKEPTIHGYWMALMKTAHDQALSGNPLVAHQLNQAAGVLLANGRHRLPHTLAEASKEK